MGPIVFSSIFLLISILATAHIVRIERATTTQKVIYIAIIWLLPVIGAVISYIGSLRFRNAKEADADLRMTDAIASKHRSTDSG